MIEVISGSATDVAAQLEAGDAASFVSVHCNCEADVSALCAVDKVQNLHGATSCLGAMTQAGATDDVAAFVLRDSDGAYGTAMRPMGGRPQASAFEATQAALMAADRLGESPDLIWVSTTPGTEEDVLAGIIAAVGDDVPIIGGSAADNSVEGNWFIFDRDEQVAEGVLITVMFPSEPVSFAYQNGYAPTEQSGVVTKCDGRTIQEIDHKPALDTYLEWTGGQVPFDRDDPETQAILSDSTLMPLGREVADVGGVPYFLLAHPAGARANGEIDLFATVEEGETLTCMSGTINGLTERAGRVASLAMAAGNTTPTSVKGALMIYCGGCMLTVRDQLKDVVTGVNTALKGAPFLGAFTFGEQGRIVGAGNRHGNLMISCIIFGK
ncbi:MAG: FIST C-terminal domain-containing protein [Rhodobacteraceae bacterium]|nr:FIST C-terminal domain-containing protein [Paracoccaceae bacterium]